MRPQRASRAMSSIGPNVQCKPAARASLAATAWARSATEGSHDEAIANGTGKMVRYPWITSRAKSGGFWGGLSSTAIFCSALNFCVSLSHSTDPASPFRMTSSGSGPGKNGAPAIWVNCPIFPSMFIPARIVSTRLATSASGILLIIHPLSASLRFRWVPAHYEPIHPSIGQISIIMALSDIVNTMCYNSPMRDPILQSLQSKAKPFAQAIPSASASLKLRKQQVVRDALSAAAERLFLSQGFEETTVEQIALAAGVSRRTFFRYYKSKEDVMVDR